MTDDRPLLVLASASPRRRELLGLLGLPFRVEPADIDEQQGPAEAPFDYVRRLSEEKARVVTKRIQAPRALVIAADTIVLLHGRVFGKPADEAHARQMLLQLREKTHLVLTSVSVMNSGSGKLITDVCQSKVHIREMSGDEIEAYVRTGDPMDKAAAYAIQNTEFAPADQVVGCPANVMGLPMCHLVMLLRRHGVTLPPSEPLACQVRYGGYYCAIADVAMPGLTERGVIPKI